MEERRVRQRCITRLIVKYFGITVRFRTEVRLIVMVQSDESVLSSRCVRGACGVHGNTTRTVSTRYGCLYGDNVRIDWAEVPFYSPDFFLEYFMPESCLELTLSQGRGRDTHGFLPTTKKDLQMMLRIVMTKTRIWTHVRLFWCNSCAVQWRLSHISLQLFQSFRYKEL